MAAVLTPRKRLYGVTHRPDGERIERQVRVLKIAIGVPSNGPDVHVWLTHHADKPWCVDVGGYQGRSRKAEVKTFGTRGEAEAFYTSARRGAPKCVAPRKLPYYTFLRQGVDGFVHDFDAIEKHGPMPTEIDIVFLSDDPFDPNFAMYNATELLCTGDGIDAKRKLALATPAEAELVQIARDNGEKYFPIESGCYTMGCPYIKEGKCKPHARLFFQLPHSIRLGGTCTFETTGFRSINQLDTSITQIKTITGRGDEERGRLAGIPLKLVLRPYRASYTDSTGESRVSTQFAVSLEYRARSASDLARLLIRDADGYREALALGPAADDGETIEATAQAVDDTVVLSEEQELADAAAFQSEFVSAAEVSGDGFDEFNNGETATTANVATMPRRRSEAATTPATSPESSLGGSTPLVIAGVTFPAQIMATGDDDLLTRNDYNALVREAERMNIKQLDIYCESQVGLPANELTHDAAMALLKVMAQAPTRSKR